MTKVYLQIRDDNGDHLVDTTLQGMMRDGDFLIPFTTASRADECFRLIAAKVRKDVDPEDWGVYDAKCKLCGKELKIVATTHSIEFGYAEVMPNDALCLKCRG